MTLNQNPTGFEEKMQKAMDAPEPDPEKMNALRERFIAQGVTRHSPVHNESAATISAPNARPNKSASARSIFTRRPAWQWAALSLAVVAVLVLASPAAVKALRSVLEYVPGIGLLEQSPEAFVLAEAVRVERDGFTLTIDQAVATAEKTVVVYQYREPASAGSLPQPSAADRMRPVMFPVLVLPDGSTLPVLETQSQTLEGNGALTVLTFAPLPAGVDRATLEFTRLNGMPPGEGPEDWQIALRFAPGDLTQVALPVIDYAPTPLVATQAAALPQPTVAVEQTAGQMPAALRNIGLKLAVDKAVELEDSTILMGSLSWNDPSISSVALWLAEPPVITGADGQPVAFEFAPPEFYQQPEETRHYWAYKILSKDFAAPLSLAFNVVYWQPVEASFQFDPGADVQNGQVWDLNLDVPVGERSLKVVSAQYLQPEPGLRVFDLTLASDPDVVGAIVEDLNKSPIAGGGEGNSISAANGQFTTSFDVASDLSAGPLTVVIRSLQLLVPGDWTVTWAP